MIDKNDKLKVPKRLYIIDYQLKPCEIDGISDARLNAFPFNTTEGKLVEYLCLDTLWHDASEEPKDKSAILLRYTGSMCKWASLDEVDADDWKQTVKELGITRWLYIDDLFPKEGGNHD